MSEDEEHIEVEPAYQLGKDKFNKREKIVGIILALVLCVAVISIWYYVGLEKEPEQNEGYPPKVDLGELPADCESRIQCWKRDSFIYAQNYDRNTSVSDYDDCVELNKKQELPFERTIICVKIENETQGKLEIVG